MLQMCATLWLLIVCFVSVSAKDEHHYTSVESLKNLLQYEEKIVQLLEEYLEMKQINKGKDTMANYIKVSKLFLERLHTSEDPFYHPINGYHFLKHLLYDWKGISQELRERNSSESEKVLNQINTLKDMASYPNRDEVLNAAASISRMQQFFNMSIDTLVEGNIEDQETGKVFSSIMQLSSWDCHEIGRGALALEDFKGAIKWFNIAKRMSSDGTIDDNLVMENLERAKRMLEKTETPKQYYHHYGNEALDVEDTTEEMARLCRGEATKPKPSKMYLSCKYFTRGEPFLRIGPLKLEEISKNPTVMLFHKFATNEEMQKIVEVSAQNLQPSPHLLVKRGVKFGTTLMRVSKQHLFGSEDDPGTEESLADRIETATGLKVRRESSLKYVIVNYGIAGACLPHMDSLSGANKTVMQFQNPGDKIATVMIYLGNVTLGGATIFPHLGVSVRPERGAALLWYNLLKSGTEDSYSLHGGCPVVYGSKWVATKWILNHDQMFKQPCGFQSLSRHKLEHK